MELGAVVTMISTGILFPIITAICVGIFRVAVEFKEFRAVMSSFRDNVAADIKENKKAHEAIIIELRAHMAKEEDELRELRAQIRAM